MPNSEVLRRARVEVTQEPGQSSHLPQDWPQNKYAKSQNERAPDPGPRRKRKENAAMSQNLEAEKAKKVRVR